MSDVVHDFVTDALLWQPYLTPVALEEATPAQREALKETPSGTKISDYVLVLAHDPQALGERTLLFNGIMYGRGGLSRAERELGAMEASVVNRCIYCASVHAGRYIQLTKQPDTITHVFAGDTSALGPRARAIADFSAKLSQSPPQSTQADISALREVGLSNEEIIDLVFSVTIFGWANR